MKKTKFFLPLFSLVLLAGCTGPNSSSQGTLDIDEVITNSKNSNLFAYEAATSIGLLATINPTTVKSAKREASQQLIDQVKEYLPSIEAALRGNDLLLNNFEVESDREEYKTKLVVTYKDVSLAETSFTMYYNETPTGDRDDHDEEEAIIDGLVVVGENEYQMRGEKERENDELEVSFSYHLDDNNYVRVSQEIENDEQEFEYEVYENKRLIHSYSLEMENDEVELHSQSIGQNLYLEFSFFKRDDHNYISCYVVNNQERERILFEKIVDDQGVVTYNVVQ